MGQDTTGKTNTSEEKKQGTERAAFVPLWVAVVTGIVTITVALIGSPLFEKWLEPKPTPSPTFTASVSASPPTGSFSPTSTETILPVLTPSLEVIPPATVAPNLPSPTSSETAIMYVSIAANRTSGEAPLTVKFDARDSYVVAPDGTRFECRKGACRYTWHIFLNGQAFATPDTTGGTLEFRFQNKGTYSVSVYICHGSKSPTCGNGATLVIAN